MLYANLKHGNVSKFQVLCVNCNRNCKKYFENFYFRGICAEKPLQLWPFNGFSLQIDMPRLNMKISKNHHYGVKLQQKWLHKDASTKKLFRNWHSLGCANCIKSEKKILLTKFKFFWEIFHSHQKF